MAKLNDNPPMEDSNPSLGVMTVEELAQLLRVNRKAVYSEIAKGRIPGVRRVGRSIRISKTAVTTWLYE